MAIESKLSHTAALILQTIHAGYVYGFSVMEITGLPSALDASQKRYPLLAKLIPSAEVETA